MMLSMESSERIAKLETQVDAIKEDVTELKSDVKDLHSRITTGNREILEKIDSMEHRMEERMDTSAVNAAKQHHEIELNVKKDITKIAERVDVLERWRWMIVGGALVLGYSLSNLGIFSKIFQ